MIKSLRKAASKRDNYLEPNNESSTAVGYRQSLFHQIWVRCLILRRRLIQLTDFVSLKKQNKIQ